MILSEIDLRNGPIKFAYFVTPCSKRYENRGGALRSIQRDFPREFKLFDILLTLPVATATVELSFRHIKIVKTRLRNRLSDNNLMCNVIEGPELT